MSEERAGDVGSMEDILASIRKIISKDDVEPQRGAAAADSGDESPGAASMEPPAASSRSVVPEPRVVQDDLSDILETEDTPEPQAGAASISSFGSVPRAKGEEVSANAARGALDRVAGDKGTSAQSSRNRSLTERLSLRERMASLDLDGGLVTGRGHSDLEPAMRRQVKAERLRSGDDGLSATGRETAGGDSVGAAEGSGSTGGLPSGTREGVEERGAGRLGGAEEEGAAHLGRTVSAISHHDRDGQGVPGPLSAGDGTRKTERVTGHAGGGEVPAVQIVAPKGGELIGSGVDDPGDEGRVSGPGSVGQATLVDKTPSGGARKNVSFAARETAGSPVGGGVPAIDDTTANGAGGVQDGGGAPYDPTLPMPGSKERAAAGSASADRLPRVTTDVIPSSDAVDVAALNEAGRQCQEKRGEPSEELIEATREALHGDLAQEADVDVKPAAGAPSLEDVVREALRPVLKEWLDQNLPKLIEAQLRREVERALSKAQRDAAG